MIDIAELSSLKEDAETYEMVHSPRVRQVIDALEKAQGERDRIWGERVAYRDAWMETEAQCATMAAESDRLVEQLAILIAERDSARALLQEAYEEFESIGEGWTVLNIRSRIEAELKS